MSTKTTAIGPNSIALNYSINATQEEILDGVEAFIITKGWEAFDKEAGTHMRVYRALNADASSYKYVMLDTNHASYFSIRVYESWDAETHSGTNEAEYGVTHTYSQRLSLEYSGYLYIFATARWLISQSRINDGSLGSTNGESWNGCIEIARDNKDEVAGEFPIYGWVHGHGAVGFHASSSYPTAFSVPRTPFDATGYNAHRPMTISTVAGLTWSSNARLYEMLPQGTNPLGANNNIFVLTPFAYETTQYNGTFNLRGRFYGMKFLSRNMGSFLDKISINCDTDAFYSPDGEAVDHHILTCANNVRFAIPS